MSVNWESVTEEAMMESIARVWKLPCVAGGSWDRNAFQSNLASLAAPSSHSSTPLPVANSRLPGCLPCHAELLLL